MRLDGNPGWTDERVQLASKLWTDGWSATEIACRLGWVTRSAVLGKLKRLGLLTRKRNERIAADVRREPATVISFPRLRASISHWPRPRQSPPRRVTSRVTQELEIPQALRVDLLDLRECMCRFPIGDPKDDAFHFCGRDKADGISYCDHHARIAFKPATPRRPGGFRLQVRYG
jgi:GcrA cell cycle regulator